MYIILLCFISIISGGVGDTPTSLLMCQEVNLIRAKYGLRALSHSPAMQYTAESHLNNLLSNNFPIFQGDPCDGHSWFADASLGVSYCCSQGGCMGDKASLLTRNWGLSGGFPYTGISVENYYAISQSGGFFGGTITTSGATARGAVLSWEQSPGHNRTMNGAYMVCGGAISDVRVDVSSTYYTYDGIVLLWVGTTNDTNIRIPTPQPGSNPTKIPTRLPTPHPTLQNPTLQPVQPTPTPTQSNVVVSKCPALENYCWARCGAPDIFSFLENCGATRDGGIISCKTPVGCNCDVPDIYKTTLPPSWGIVSPSTCENTVCAVNWNTLIPGSIKWCQACANNCSGYQNDCINNGDFCRYNCAGMQMCARWRQRQCNKGDTEMCLGVGATPNPTWGNTPHPTPAPTNQPSRGPTPHPTYQPTRDPTSHPTNQPTRDPTLQPTYQPSQNPTRSPTLQPTHFPSPNPSQGPTSYPSKNPTNSPTSNPTPAPTQSTDPSKNGYMWSVVAVFFLLGIACILITLVIIGYKFKWYQYVITYFSTTDKKENEIEMQSLVSSDLSEASRVGRVGRDCITTDTAEKTFRDNKFDEIADTLSMYDKIQVMIEVMQQNATQDDMSIREVVGESEIVVHVIRTGNSYSSTISITKVLHQIQSIVQTGKDSQTAETRDIIKEKRRHHRRHLINTTSDSIDSDVVESTNVENGIVEHNV